MVWLLLRHERLLLPVYGKRRGEQVMLLLSVNGFRFPCKGITVGSRLGAAPATTVEVYV
jgi:hypothetical protein